MKKEKEKKKKKVPIEVPINAPKEVPGNDPVIKPLEILTDPVDNTETIC